VPGAAGVACPAARTYGLVMPRPDRSNAIDHVVVIMFENRSFDNLLGRLYEPGEVASFAGVTGLDLSNPVPEWAADAGTAPKLVPYGTAVGMNVPSPDPGEEYQHVNTQLFGLIDPPSNRGMVAQHIVAPYNAPADPGQPPTMDGFITDYISAFMAETGRPPVFEEYAQIMTGYVPLQVPVTSALARGFATFDHWFCEVPSQTFPNRSFFHAGTSSGFVVNMSPAESFPVHNTAETIFERLEAAGLTWRVYSDPPSHISLTGIIHAPRLLDRFETNFFTTDRFLADAANGQLPTYSFIEPNLLYGHNDMHPAFDALFPGVDLDPPSALLGGEALLAKIYDAVRTSSTPDGSNAYNTLLMITFDEHGGTYDHVPPPLVPPPGPSAPAGQMGFTFGRSGVRVPAIAVSAWIGENTVINDEHRHTSVIRTLRERWQLGAPLTGRDGAARDLASVLSLDSPRDPADWPEVVPQPVPPFVPARISLEARLKGLSRAACFPVLALAKNLGLPAPDIGEDEAMARADAMELIDDVFGDMFPGLHGS
jgi:phospholipase C